MVKYYTFYMNLPDKWWGRLGLLLWRDNSKMQEWLKGKSLPVKVTLIIDNRLSEKNAKVNSTAVEKTLYQIHYPSRTEVLIK